MICLTMCSLCVHNRKEKKDGWIPTCDAYPNGQPLLDKEFDERVGTKICNPENEIGYEPSEFEKNGCKNSKFDRYKKFCQ